LIKTLTSLSKTDYMKRCWHVVCFSILLAIIPIATLGMQLPIYLAKNSITKYVITIDTRASAPEKHAAEELSELLKQATGANFPICTPAEAGKRPQLAVGFGAARAIAPDLSLNGLGADGIIIKATSPNIILTGGLGAPRGTLYAVYTFLEDYVGFRWWTSSETTIPKKSSLKVRDDLNIRYVPALERRESYYVEAFEKDFAVRSKNNGFYGTDDSRGGNLSYAGPGCHTFFVLVPPEKYFAEHPDWYSEINGVRIATGNQLCLTNPELLKFVISQVKQWLRDNPKAAYISLTQNDNAGWCTCAKCKAVDDAEGGQSGTMIRFVNAVAEAIEPEFPNVAVDTFAYQYTRKAPKITKPRKNVVVRLCSIECNFAKPLDDKSNMSFRKDIADWSKLTDRLYIWDYVTNFAHYLQAHPNLRVIGPNVRFYVKNHVKGLFEQGDYQCVGSEFGALRSWMLGKLLWNPDSNDKALLKEFLNGYYGPAAPHINRYINLIHDTEAKSNFYMSIGAQPNAPYVAPAILDKSAKIFEQALSAVADKPEYLRRVEIAEMSVMYSRISQIQAQYFKDGKLDDLKELDRILEKFIRIAQRENITMISEGAQLLDWAKRMRRMVSDNGASQTVQTVTTARGDITVVRLATTWLFAPDPKEAGINDKWFATSFDDTKWSKNRTDYDCGWEKQGYPGYTGFGWYRQKFDLPAEIKQKHIYVHFEAIDEEGWIYLNGGDKPAFEHTCVTTKLAPDHIWITPFMFEATNSLKSGELNLLSVRVYNAAQMGGIWRPVYIIASDSELTLEEAQGAVKQMLG